MTFIGAGYFLSGKININIILLSSGHSLSEKRNKNNTSMNSSKHLKFII